jgi:hypothetical protein
VSIAVKISLLFYKKFNLIPFWLEEEKKADLDAKRILQSGSGGVYFLKVIQSYQILLQEEALKNVIKKQENGDPVLKNGKPVFDLPKFNIMDPIGTFKNWKNWGENWMTIIAIDKNGNNQFDVVHPPLTDRITYLTD